MSRMGSDEGMAGGAVLVTGGSSGLGAAVVDAVAKRGATPVVLDRQPPPDGAAFVPVDLADSRAAQQAVADATELAGQIGRASCRERG